MRIMSIISLELKSSDLRALLGDDIYEVLLRLSLENSDESMPHSLQQIYSQKFLYNISEEKEVNYNDKILPVTKNCFSSPINAKYDIIFI